MLSADNTKKRFEEMLGKKAAGFISSVLQVVGNNSYLQNADPASVMTSAAIAASLDLPINPNLGYAAIIPYNDKGKGQVAQFQIMTRGIIQLAIRSGQYSRITNSIVYEGQLVKQDPFTDEYVFDFNAKKSNKIIGYVAYFRTIGGFEKYYYMTKEEVESHGKKYSKTFKSGVWQTDFNSMALKTVLKLLLSKYGILSVEMQKAVEFDQSVIKGDINNIEEATAEYIDNEQVVEKPVLTEEQMFANYEKVKNNPKAAEIALAKGEITLDLFNQVIDNNM
jgi:recombination protein RecT